MSKPPNLHSNFFSSLKQVEKRLKLEDNSSHSLNISANPLPQPPKIDSTSTESLSSPIFLHSINQNLPNKSSVLEDSEIPVEFLTNSLDFPPTNEESLPEKPLLNPPETQKDGKHEDIDVDVDEIGLLIELLGLSDFEENESNLGLETCSSCHCDDGFLGKIVGMKGPKCKKEMERLEGWINHFRNEKIEPFRLAHLLLGKAAFLHGNCDNNGGGFEELEFPSTVEEFLRHDPPQLPKEDTSLV